MRTIFGSTLKTTDWPMGSKSGLERVRESIRERQRERDRPFGRAECAHRHDIAVNLDHELFHASLGGLRVIVEPEGNERKEQREREREGEEETG